MVFWKEIATSNLFRKAFYSESNFVERKMIEQYLHNGHLKQLSEVYINKMIKKLNFGIKNH